MPGVEKTIKSVKGRDLKIVCTPNTLLIEIYDDDDVTLSSGLLLGNFLTKDPSQIRELIGALLKGIGDG